MVCIIVLCTFFHTFYQLLRAADKDRLRKAVCARGLKTAYKNQSHAVSCKQERKKTVAHTKSQFSTHEVNMSQDLRKPISHMTSVTL